MPNEPPNLKAAFEEVCQDIKHFQTTTAEMTAAMRDPERRARIEALLKDFNKAFARVEDAVPKAINWVEEKHAANMEQARAIKAKAEALRQKIEERKAKPPEKAARKPPAPAIDPLHGMVLRKEVLERFGTKAAVAHAAAGSGDVASMSSDKWAAEPSSKQPPAVSAKPVPAPEKGAARPRGDDVTDISSGAWDKDEPQ